MNMTLLAASVDIEIMIMFLVTLAVVVLILTVTFIRRMKGMNQVIDELKEQNDTLLAKAAAEKAEPKTESPEPAPAVKPAPVVATPAPQPVVTATNNSPEPEVVAAIIAAIECCGFAADDIRSIRPHRAGNGWVMAGRIANMQ